MHATMHELSAPQVNIHEQESRPKSKNRCSTAIWLDESTHHVRRGEEPQIHPCGPHHE